MNILVRLTMILRESSASELLILRRRTPEPWRHLALLKYSLATMNKPNLYSFHLIVIVHCLNRNAFVIVNVIPVSNLCFFVVRLFKITCYVSHSELVF